MAPIYRRTLASGGLNLRMQLNRTSCTPVFLKVDKRFSGDCDDGDLFVNENGGHTSVDNGGNARPHLLQTFGAKSLGRQRHQTAQDPNEV